MGKLNFQQSLLQSLVSHGPSEIILISWFVAQETFNIIINVKISCAAESLCENDTFQDSLISKVQKQHLFEIANVFTVTFDQ